MSMQKGIIERSSSNSAVLKVWLSGAAKQLPVESIHRALGVEKGFGTFEGGGVTYLVPCYCRTDEEFITSTAELQKRIRDIIGFETIVRNQKADTTIH